MFLCCSFWYNLSIRGNLVGARDPKSKCRQSIDQIVATCPHQLIYYLSKLKTVFVQIENSICPNWKLNLSKLKFIFVQIEKCICPKVLWPKIFVKCRQSIDQIVATCPHQLIYYLSKLKTVFVQIENSICPNWKLNLSKLKFIFVQIEKCICPKVLWPKIFVKCRQSIDQIGATRPHQLQWEGWLPFFWSNLIKFDQI